MHTDIGRVVPHLNKYVNESMAWCIGAYREFPCHTVVLPRFSRTLRMFVQRSCVRLRTQKQSNGAEEAVFGILVSRVFVLLPWVFLGKINKTTTFWVESRGVEKARVFLFCAEKPRLVWDIVGFFVRAGPKSKIL